MVYIGDIQSPNPHFVQVRLIYQKFKLWSLESHFNVNIHYEFLILELEVLTR